MDADLIPMCGGAVCVSTLGKFSHPPASVTKQYNLATSQALDNSPTNQLADN